MKKTKTHPRPLRKSSLKAREVFREGKVIVNEWTGCYPSSWKGSIVAEAMGHPAKFSSKLIRKIYDHMLEEGWVKAGDAVLDPFGGVALGALDAMRLGLHWVGVELEEKFFKIGNENIRLWDDKFGSMPRWGSAKLLHGDSRKLNELLVRGELSVTSPPYADSDVHFESNRLKEGKGKKYKRPYMDGQQAHYGSTPGQLGAMKAEKFESVAGSPPFAQQQEGGGLAAALRGKSEYQITVKGKLGKNQGYMGQGKTGGQLANMKEITPAPNAVTSSPPFLQSEGGTPEPKPGGVIDKALYERHKAGNKKAEGYGGSDGQLHHMPVITPAPTLATSSPPYNETRIAESGIDYVNSSMRRSSEKKYGDTYEKEVDDFWLAAREIVRQVYEALEPGGHACWVVKDYVKAKQIVPFSNQWRALCEAVGFVTLHEHRAMLVHHKGKQGMLDGGVHEVKTESKSFFRRIAERKGSPRIDWEVVWCMVKPNGR